MRGPDRTVIGQRAHLEARLLGGCVLRVGDRVVSETAFRRRRSFTLLLFLLSTPGHRAPRDQVLEVLWPDKDPEESEQGLRVVLTDIRGTIPGDPPCILGRGPLISLHPDLDLVIDADLFESAALRALESRDSDALQQAAALYAGPFLAERPGDDWALARRDQLGRLHERVLLALADLEDETNPVAAERRLRALFSADPTDEASAQRLMRSLQRQGRPAEALRVYHALVTALRDELDLGPGAETEALRAALLGPSAGSASIPSAARNATPPRTNNFPTPTTAFVGREWELADVRALLLQPPAGCRLLTLTGAGGCGKTRLALEVARAMLPHFADGAWLVELAPLTDPALLAQTMLAALGLQEGGQRTGARSIEEWLVQALQDRRLLLILDNCEHLVRAVADLALTLLQRCPSVQILATSREPLGTVGETTWLVPSLALPPATQRASAAPATPAEIARYDAIRLFIERARGSKPWYQITEMNAPMIAQVCRRLDGIPLALELAAAQLRAISVEDLAARLGDRFTLLAGGNRAALPRHRTLRATIDWSYALLDDREQLLLQRLSVFAGGCTIESAAAVCTGDSIAPADVLGLLSRLVTKPLVPLDERPDANGAIRARYTLLDTVRQYARERLRASGEAGERAVRDRHAAYFVELAEHAGQALAGQDQERWLDRLEAEHDNLRAALAWIRTQGAVNEGLRIAGAIWRFWVTRGYVREGRTWLEDFLANGAPDDARIDAGVRSKALKGAGALAYYQADYPRALDHYDRSLVIAMAIGDTHGMASALNNLGLVRKDQGDYAAAIALYERSLALYRQIGDLRGCAMALNNLGIAAGDQGDAARAATFHEESLRLKRDLGDARGIISSLNNLGVVVTDLGDFPRARLLLEEALARARELDHRWSMHVSLSSLGRLAHAAGNAPEALSHYRESLALCRVAGNDLYMAIMLEGAAALARDAGRWDVATRLCAAAIGLCERTGARLPASDLTLHERTLAACRDALGVGFAPEWDAGRLLTRDEAIALVAAMADLYPAAGGTHQAPAAWPAATPPRAARQAAPASPGTAPRP